MRALAAICALAGPAQATQSCGGEPGWAATEFSARINVQERYSRVIGARQFVLDPTPHGWRIRVFGPDGLEDAVFAAPIRPVETNPVNIAGWHFRNRANTGPNSGDVNAPQHLRRFVFGTLATDAALNPAIVAPVRGQTDGGLGELRITDLTLSPVVKGARAHIEAMAFTACLAWTGAGVRHDPIVDVDPGVAFASAVAEMKGCGLDTQVYKLSDRMASGGERGSEPILRPDLDGDNIPDLVIPLRRRSDGAPGLALCLIGDETLLLAGYDGRIGAHLDPAYFKSADWWAIHRGPVGQGVAEGPPPMPIGDAIVMGKDDSSSVLILLDGERRLTSYWQGD